MTQNYRREKTTYYTETGQGQTDNKTDKGRTVLERSEGTRPNGSLNLV